MVKHALPLTRKANLVLRALLNPDMVYVIPNAIVADSFKPDMLKPRYTGGPREQASLHQSALI